MLVLSRKKDESIVINDDITIVVVEIRGDKVRLGIEAPKEVPVHRREVFESIVEAPLSMAASLSASGSDEPMGDAASRSDGRPQQIVANPSHQHQFAPSPPSHPNTGEGVPTAEQPRIDRQR
jgi:carbon storage regulator